MIVVGGSDDSASQAKPMRRMNLSMRRNLQTFLDPIRHVIEFRPQSLNLHISFLLFAAHPKGPVICFVSSQVDTMI